MNTLRAFMACLAALTFSTAVQAAPSKTCSIVTAPAHFSVHSSGSHGPSAPDDGIVPTGFVGIRGASTIQGIDVSKYQGEAKFTSVYDCGGRFAYVRLSAGTDLDNELVYRTHWSNARGANKAAPGGIESGLIPGGYHNLAFPVELTSLKGAPPGTITASIGHLSELAASSAALQASNFLGRLDEVVGLDPKGHGQYHYLPMALDLSTDPLASGTAAQKAAFGPLYTTMVCAFLAEVGKSKHGDEPVIVYVAPDTYTSYQLQSAKCDISKVFLWLRFRATDGLDYSRHMPREAVAALCLRPPTPFDAGLGNIDAASGKANRCIMEQYTSYGGFAVFQPGAPLDLNRFFLTPGALQHLEQTEQ